jgi:hypothetical protein
MLQKLGFQPGINKQITETQAEGQWTDCDNVRFRYGIPEKIGGWNQLGTLNETHFQEVYFTIYIPLKRQLRLQVHLARLTDHRP